MQAWGVWEGLALSGAGAHEQGLLMSTQETMGDVLVTFLLLLRQKYLTLKVKGGKGYVAHSLQRFQPIISWLPAGWCMAEGQLFMVVENFSSTQDDDFVRCSGPTAPPAYSWRCDSRPLAL